VNLKWETLYIFCKSDIDVGHETRCWKPNTKSTVQFCIAVFWVSFFIAVFMSNINVTFAKWYKVSHSKDSPFWREYSNLAFVKYRKLFQKRKCNLSLNKTEMQMICQGRRTTPRRIMLPSDDYTFVLDRNWMRVLDVVFSRKCAPLQRTPKTFNQIASVIGPQHKMSVKKRRKREMSVVTKLMLPRNGRFGHWQAACCLNSSEKIRSQSEK
jgi:hypothetical protein